MQPFKSHEIKGNYATLLLPINDDDSIDFSRLKDELDAFIAFRVSGIYSNGTAGEFYTQSEDEFDRVSELLAERCERTRTPFQIGLSHTSAQIALARLQRAVALKPTAFQVILPDWFKLTDDEAVAFLSRMAEHSQGIPFILYNPPHAKRVLTGAELRAIAQKVPNVIGAKVGDVSPEWFQELRGSGHSQLSIFTPGHLLAKHITYGSSGAYSNVACLHPRGAQLWYELMLTDLTKAQDIAARLLAFFAAHITPLITVEKYPNAAVDKLLAAIGNWSDVGTRMRWPYRSIDPARAVPLRQIARSQIPELLDPR